jgi:hypothetical protein
MRTIYKILMENIKGRDHLGDIGVDWKIILKWILKKQRLRMWTRILCHKIRSSGGFF